MAIVAIERRAAVRYSERPSLRTPPQQPHIDVGRWTYVGGSGVEELLGVLRGGERDGLQSGQLGRLVVLVLTLVLLLAAARCAACKLVALGLRLLRLRQCSLRRRLSHRRHHRRSRCLGNSCRRRCRHRRRRAAGGASAAATGEYLVDDELPRAAGVGPDR
jgi:hypothetical protein